MAELRGKGISLERSGLMHFLWILGFVLYIGLIYFLGVGRVVVERGLCRPGTYTQVFIRLSMKDKHLGSNIS